MRFLKISNLFINFFSLLLIRIFFLSREHFDVWIFRSRTKWQFEMSRSRFEK